MLRSITGAIDTTVTALDGVNNSVETAENQAVTRARRNQKPTSIADAYTVWDAYDPGPLVQDWMEPIGDSGIYFSPLNEAVSPLDCDRWPDSPYCGGNGLSLRDRAIGIGRGVSVETSFNQCEICFTVSGGLIRLSGPPLTACYRRPNCRIEDNPQTLPEPDTSGHTATLRNCSDGSYLIWERGGIDIDTQTFFDQRSAIENPGAISLVNLAQAEGWLIDEFPLESRTFHDINSRLVKVKGDERTILINYYFADLDQLQPENLVNYPIVREEATIYHVYPYGRHRGYSPGLIRTWTVTDAYFPECDSIILSPAPYHPVVFGGPDPMPCNCDEMAELLECLYVRLGCDQYPVSVPDSLLETEANGQVEKGDLTALMGWLIEQVDAVTGQFPIDIQVEDIDPTQAGAQSKQITLPNLSETLADLYGLTLKTAISNDLHTNFLLRLVAEILAIKNSSVVTQDYVKANASFLGYRGNPQKRKINYSFDPSDLNNLNQLFQESTKEIVGWVEDDPETVVGFLQRIVFVSGMLKEVFFRNKDRLGNVMEEIESLSDQDDSSDQTWKQFIAEINNPGSLRNQGQPNPKVTDINTDSDPPG